MILTKQIKEKIKRVKDKEQLEELLEKATGEVKVFIEERLFIFKTFNI